MSDLLNIFCCSRLKEFQSIRLPSQNKPEILIPPPMSSSDLSSSDNMTTNTYNGATSIKILLEKAYSKKVSTKRFPLFSKNWRPFARDDGAGAEARARRAQADALFIAGEASVAGRECIGDAEFDGCNCLNHGLRRLRRLH